MNAIIEALKEKCKHFFKNNQKLLKYCSNQGFPGGIELQNNGRKIIIKRDLLNRADNAMYLAKHKGKNRYYVDKQI